MHKVLSTLGTLWAANMMPGGQKKASGSEMHMQAFGDSQMSTEVVGTEIKTVVWIVSATKPKQQLKTTKYIHMITWKDLKKSDK